MKPHQSICLTAALLLLAATCSAVQGEDLAANPTGTWQVTLVTTNTLPHSLPQTLKLKLDGSILTGTLSYFSGPMVNGKAPRSTLPITEAKVQGNEISFSFTHPPAAGNGPNATYNYHGTIHGDTLKGTITTEWMGQAHTRDWEGKRLKE